jgi:hypothetical protein
MKPVTLRDLKKHIKKCNRLGHRYNWLGYVETRDLSPEVEALFTLSSPTGSPAYNWVSGNEKLAALIAQLTSKG